MRSRSGSLPRRTIPMCANGSMRPRTAFAEAAGFEPKARPPSAAAGRRSEPLARRRSVRARETPTTDQDLFLPGRLRANLPDGIYRFANEPHDARLAALAVALGSYASRATAKPTRRRSSSICRKASTAKNCEHIVEGVSLARDLINTPANDMGPARARSCRAQACGAARCHNSPPSSATICWRRIFRSFMPSAAPRFGAPRLIDFTVGRRQASARDAGRQGRLLRHRRARYQARRVACSI